MPAPPIVHDAVDAAFDFLKRLQSSPGGPARSPFGALPKGILDVVAKGVAGAIKHGDGKKTAGGGSHGSGGGAHMLRVGSSGKAVVVLQHSLNALGAKPPLAEDGKFGPMTEAAVRRFQQTRGLKVDGVVGPATWHALNAQGIVAAIMHKAVSGTLKGMSAHGSVARFFPLARRPSVDWRSASHCFGAPRTGRLHAGCDLLATPGTAIFSVGDGKLVRGPYEFTGRWMGLPSTEAVEISYGDVLVRYGEIAPGSYKGGSSPACGEKIAKVGALQMLHFELYSNGQSKSSLDGGGRYLRRSDLVDPSPSLLKWVKNLPTP